MNGLQGLIQYFYFVTLVSMYHSILDTRYQTGRYCTRLEFLSVCSPIMMTLQTVRQPPHEKWLQSKIEICHKAIYFFSSDQYLNANWKYNHIYIMYQMTSFMFRDIYFQILRFTFLITYLTQIPAHTLP